MTINLQKPRFCDYLVEKIGEIPLFLSNGLSRSVPALAFSALQLFWVSGHDVTYHPWMEGAILVAVDANSRRKPRDNGWTHVHARPIYLVLERSGRYLIGFCRSSQGRLTLVPHPDCRVPPLEFVNGQDAEVVGEVVAIARLIF